MNQEQAIDCRYLLGTTLLVAMIFGGGTASGQLLDMLLQIAIIGSSLYTLIRLRHLPSSGVGMIMLLLVVGVGAAQLVPLPLEWIDGVRPDVFLPRQPGNGQFQPIATISLSVFRSLQALMTMISGLFLFLAFAKLPEKDAEGILPFFMGGLVLNAAFVVLQASNGNFEQIAALLGHPVNAGLFLNENHASTLFCAAIPMLFYLGFVRGQLMWILPLVALLLLCLLAIGSRAGIWMGLGVLLLALFVPAWRFRLGGLLALCLLAIVAIYGFGAFSRIGGEVEGILDRSDFYRTSLQALQENWILGTGFGTFDLIYPHYERLEDVYSVYVNHAHNDVLEFVLEGGIAGALIVLVYLAVFLVRLARMGDQPLRFLSALAIGVVIVHSTVDYPLRTLAIVAIFAFFNGLFFMPETKAQPAGVPAPEGEVTISV